MMQVNLPTEMPTYAADELKQFGNLAGLSGVDEQVKGELQAAEIDIQEFPVTVPGEVQTSVFGTLHSWRFTRAWRYWACQGPGLDLAYANWLHVMAGNSARVGGDCTAPAPIDVYKGLGCGVYHCDTPFSLRMLVRAINSQVRQANAESDERNDRPPVKIPAFNNLAALHIGLFNTEGVLRIQKLDETAPDLVHDEDATRMVISLAADGRADALLMLHLDGHRADDAYVSALLQLYGETEEDAYEYATWKEWDDAVGKTLNISQAVTRQVFEAGRMKKQHDS